MCTSSSRCPAGYYCTEGVITSKCVKSTGSVAGASAATCTACPSVANGSSYPNSDRTGCNVSCNARYTITSNGQCVADKFWQFTYWFVDSKCESLCDQYCQDNVGGPGKCESDESCLCWR